MKKIKLFVCAVLSTMLMLLSGCVAKMPIPEIKEGRLNFSVTYETNGEEKTYSGVYVCKYDGILVTLAGSSVQWKAYIENEEEIDIPIQTNEDGVIYINLGLSADYLMGSPSALDYPSPEPNLYMIFNGDDPDSPYITSDEEVIFSYGVRLISYNYADPIKNTFKEQIAFGRFEPSIN